MSARAALGRLDAALASSSLSRGDWTYTTAPHGEGRVHTYESEIDGSRVSLRRIHLPGDAVPASPHYRYRIDVPGDHSQKDEPDSDVGRVVNGVEGLFFGPGPAGLGEDADVERLIEFLNRDLRAAEPEVSWELASLGREEKGRYMVARCHGSRGLEQFEVVRRWPDARAAAEGAVRFVELRAWSGETLMVETAAEVPVSPLADFADPLVTRLREKALEARAAMFAGLG